MYLDWTNLKTKLTELERELERLSNEALIPIANRFKSEFDERVFEEGKNVSGRIRRGYKSNAYQNRKKKQFGIFPTSFVNLRRSEDMRKGVENLGRIARKNTVRVGFRSDRLAKRLEFNEKRFGQIRGATDKEGKLLRTLFIEEILRRR